eukprot:13989260-Alexandrium_andersonii.AAC.1
MKERLDGAQGLRYAYTLLHGGKGPAVNCQRRAGAGELSFAPRDADGAFRAAWGAAFDAGPGDGPDANLLATWEVRTRELRHQAAPLPL